MSKHIVSFILFLLTVVLPSVVFASGDGGGHHGVDGAGLSVFWVIPFVGILLSIAILPLVKKHLWEENYGKISLFWGLALVIPYVVTFKGNAIYDIFHIYVIDYIPFIILLWSLYTISGGIRIQGRLQGHPLTNTTLLILGTIFASWIGTTGASMVLIRPILKANKSRKHKVHTIVFFIFLVSNIGGSLTPLGDPPLFLGFLHGVPFFWVFSALAIPMIVVSTMLIIIYFLMDSYFYAIDKKETLEQVIDDIEHPKQQDVTISIQGFHNLIFLAGVLGAVLFSGFVKIGHINLFGLHVEVQSIIRDALMIVMGISSLKTTSKAIRDGNEFEWEPIIEVAKLFAGIFVCIIPALAILKAGKDGAFSGLIENVTHPSHYFWITGILSSFLDNAPTYLTFYNTALGSNPEHLVAGFLSNNTTISDTGIPFSTYLMAISAGAVFMGANTYIGNAPNFMVKSIAERSGIAMPSFFGYMLKWSIPILIPCFVVVHLLFFAN